ncbi:hypothetical protein TRVA0_016S02080 [Trichomonascus vanleenenianus]|uniref:uncharacterized protein n=1 Tax=Trichomonascus vanleenenianus TaxID=2268995 RepID=UPI003ECADA85
MEDDKVAEALVRQVWKADLDVASVRKIRQAVVAQLGLDPEFFGGSWKEESRRIIDKALASRLEEEEEQKKKPDNGSTSIFVERSDMNGERPLESKSPKRPTKIKKEAPDSTLRLKENKTPDSTPKKRSARAESDSIPPSYEESNESTSSLAQEESPIKKEPIPVNENKRPAESSPTKKVKKEKKPKVEGGTKRKTTPKTQEEIARLKSQLLKCGVRKQWAKVLDPMDSDRDRINYLKNQLTLLGMTGRFSLEKARKIKEAREFEQEMKDLNADADRLLHRSSSPADSTSSRRKRIIINDDEDD